MVGYVNPNRAAGMIGTQSPPPNALKGVETLKKFRRILAACFAGILLLMVLAVLLLWARPPELLRVAANYSAKIVCSNVFLAGRDPDEVLRDDIQSMGNPVLSLMRVRVDRERGVVRANILGFVGGGLAVARPGLGCSVLADGEPALASFRQTTLAASPPTLTAAPTVPTAATAPTATAPTTTAPTAPAPTAPAALWPEGSDVATDPKLQALLADERLAGPGVRALVVVHQGRIVAERYGPGFTSETPLLGWSMTKTVMAGLIGTLVQEGKLSLDQAGFWPAAPGDGRARITLADLMAMTSGLHFDEGYEVVSDVTRMLYLEPDMAGFAHAQPLEHPVGEVWSYSSGTALILSRIAQDAANAAGAGFARERLFTPLGMSTATIEADEHGTLVGSSYMYASARDWARYGQFLMQSGVWHGVPLLPPGYVARMVAPVPASRGQYGQGQVWLWGSDPDPATPGVDPDTAFGIPPDVFWLSGHDGQHIAIIPSRELVVVRLGLTPHGVGSSLQPLVQALLGKLT
jgi:CubicO group peptidase (beta-lactamase class C family)